MGTARKMRLKISTRMALGMQLTAKTRKEILASPVSKDPKAYKVNRDCKESKGRSD
jgi:hypothetical protein